MTKQRICTNNSPLDKNPMKESGIEPDISSSVGNDVTIQPICHTNTELLNKIKYVTYNYSHGNNMDISVIVHGLDK